MARQWAAGMRRLPIHPLMGWGSILTLDLLALTQLDLRDWFARNLLTIVAIGAGRMLSEISIQPPPKLAG